MEIENFTSRINSLNDIEKFGKRKIKKQEQHKFTVKDGQMRKNIIQKPKFAQINDKRFYFSDGIVSLPFSHPSLKALLSYKAQNGQPIKKYIVEEKQKLLKMEHLALQQNERLRMLRNILSQNVTYYHLNSVKRSFEDQNINFSQTTRNYILYSFWK